MAKYLIVNADDFGYARGINQGILAAHAQGVILSTSLIVDAPWAADAAIQARECPNLGVGLHFAATNEQMPLFDIEDLDLVRRELDRQYQRFYDLLGDPPTHLDSHHHIHLREQLKPLFRAWAEAHGLVLRGMGQVSYNGKFYGQWYDENWRPHPAPEYISFACLEQILRSLPDGVTELACHPGYVTDDLDSPYRIERAIELATLLDPHCLALIQELNIKLINFSRLSSKIHMLT